MGMERRSTRMERRAMGMECRAMGMECRAMGMECHYTRMERRAMGMECRSTRMERRAMGTECRAMGKDRRSTRMERRAMGMEWSSLRVHACPDLVHDRTGRATMPPPKHRQNGCGNSRDGRDANKHNERAIGGHLRGCHRNSKGDQRRPEPQREVQEK